MQNDNLKPDSDSTLYGHAPSSPPQARSQRVIHPTPEFVQEFQAQQPQPPPQPVPQAPTPTVAQPPQPSEYRRIDPASVYPSVAQRPVPVPGTPKPSQEATKSHVSQRVAARIKSVQVYAFLIIIFGIYSATGLLSNFSSTASLFKYNPSFYILALGIAGINLVVGIYLLVAKNNKTVSALLTALLIIGGIGLARSLISLVQAPGISVNNLVSLLIPAGLLMYLWHVKSQVDLASID